MTLPAYSIQQMSRKGPQHDRHVTEWAKANNQFKQGQVIVLEQGEYSDQKWHGPFLVLRDFTQQQARDAFVAYIKLRLADKDPEQDLATLLQDLDDDPYTDLHDISQFMAFLATARFIEDLPNTREWHLGAYRLFDC